MCQNKVCIAKQGKQRFITVCQHESVQVQWDNLTLSWKVPDFRKFATMIHSQMQHGDLPHPTVVLQVNTVLAGWQTADFHRFANMVQTGMLYLDSGLERLVQKKKSQQTYHKPKQFFYAN
ncbi:MAG: hypothetical protein AAF614_20875 [Chloroflexota bacterium]